jgi:tRNA(fMet)-specific endonuclease VapC
MWLPDTNVWIAYVNPRPSPVKQAMRARPASRIKLCDIVKAELFFGALLGFARQPRLRP